MSQTDRRYDGPPTSELRRGSCPEPPPPRFRKRKEKRTKGPIVNASVYLSWTAKRWHWKDRPKRKSPFSGITYSLWGPMWTRHVIQRLCGIIKRDTRTNLLWVEDQATKAQLSPEFSSQEGLIYWLEFEGLERGWLTVVTYGYGGYRRYGNDSWYKECG